MTNPESPFRLSRVIEFDALRVIALLMIFYSHASLYIPVNPVLNIIFDNPSTIGLCLFVFLSGHGLYTSLLSRGLNQFKPLNFLKRRLVRIYPLYVLSIILYFLFFNYFKIYQSFDLQPFLRIFIGHLLCLQVLLYPKIAQMMTIWFIGMIVPFYILFMLTATLPLKKFIIANCGIFLGFVSLKFVFEMTGIELIDMRFIFYYPIFIIGAVVAALSETCSKNKQYLKPAILITLSLTVIFYWVVRTQRTLVFPPNLHLTSKDVIDAIYYFIHVSLFTALFLLTIFLCSRWLNKQKSLILYLSNLSYAAYLFQRIIYNPFYEVINNQLNLPDSVRVFLFFPITLFLFWISDRLVFLEKKFLKMTKLA